MRSLLGIPFLARIAKDESLFENNEKAKCCQDGEYLTEDGHCQSLANNIERERYFGDGDSYEFITFNIGAGDINLKRYTLGEFSKLLK